MRSEEFIQKYEKALKTYEELRKKYEKLQEQNEAFAGQNAKMALDVLQLKSNLEKAREEIEKLTSPPSSCGIFLETREGKALVSIEGKNMMVEFDPIRVDEKILKKGDRVILNEALVAIGILPFSQEGEVGIVKDIIGDRAIIEKEGMNESFVLSFADNGIKEKVKAGVRVRYLEKIGLIYEILPKTDTKKFELEEVPNITYEDIGGLEEQVNEIREAVEMPLIYPEIFGKYGYKIPKGILLWGPPGCGKTLIAKAMANSVLKKIKEKHPGKNIKGFFLNIVGPEILNKFVGETERMIREIFEKAKEKAAEGHLVLIFFDEMEALFPVRGSGISSDIEKTNVSQFLAKMDGLEEVENIVVVGASNRYDLIDPAILRQGRMDIKIEISRPKEEASSKIFLIHLTKPFIPPISKKYLDRSHKDYSEEKYSVYSCSPMKVVLKRFIPEAVKHVFAEERSFKNEKGDKETVSNKLADLIDEKGQNEPLYFKDLFSGSMAKAIIAKAKRFASVREIKTKEEGLTMSDLHKAIENEADQTREFIKNIAKDPNQWAKIVTKKSSRVVAIQPCEEKPRKIETAPTGHYL